MASEDQNTNKQNTTFEEVKARGSDLADRLRDLVDEGNARRLIIKKEGRTVMEFPLSVGVGGAAAAVLIAPTIAAIGAFVSLASDVRIVIERAPGGPEDKTSPPEATIAPSSPEAPRA